MPKKQNPKQRKSTPLKKPSKTPEKKVSKVEKIKKLEKQVERLQKKLKGKSTKQVKGKKTKSKRDKVEEYLLKSFEKLYNEEELELEIAKDIENIIQSELPKPNYKKINPSNLRYKGRFISEEFNELVLDAAKAAKKHPQDILDNPNNTYIIDNLIEKNKATTFKTTTSLIKYLKQSGKHTITVRDEDGEYQLDTNDLINRIANLEQTVRKTRDLVYIGIKTVHRIDGKIIVSMPVDTEDIEEIEDFLNSDEAEYLIYEPQ